MAKAWPLANDGRPDRQAQRRGIGVARLPYVTSRILIVEDEAVLRKHLARLFVREGYEVATAGSCAEALDQLGQGSFEALLLDVMLPDGDGLDLLADLGEQQPRRTVLMTAFSTPEKEQRAQQLNVCRVLRKPLDLLQLVGTIAL
jgi:two-component system, NtrC family, response regulator PilR